jgi:hypothetical protein
MQNRYCCDHGDFAKFGLLRKLCARDTQGRRLRLGVVWYLIPDENHNDDGKFISYLEDNEYNRERFRMCDPELWNEFRTILSKGNRHVSEFRIQQVCHESTVYYENVLEWPVSGNLQSIKGREERLRIRTDWVNCGYEKTRDCQLVVFDPDNGLNVKTKRHASKGPKYAFLDEVEPYYKRGQNLVIYQHVNRSRKVEMQIQYRLQQIARKLNCHNAFSLLYHRGTARIFLIIPADGDYEILRMRSENLCQGAWGQHFELIEKC